MILFFYDSFYSKHHSSQFNLQLEQSTYFWNPSSYNSLITYNREYKDSKSNELQTIQSMGGKAKYKIIVWWKLCLKTKKKKKSYIKHPKINLYRTQFLNTPMMKTDWITQSISKTCRNIQRHQFSTC